MAGARVVGKTVGALIHVDSLSDDKGQVSKDVHEQMGKVMQAVTRVALSTDRPLDFCAVVIRDKDEKNELVVIRSVDDMRRANADAIGIEESINRTLFGQNKLPPVTGGPVAFVLKEIKLESFLADQIVQRLRFNFSKDLKDPKDEAAVVRPLFLVEGVYETTEQGRRSYRFSILSLKFDDPRRMMINVFKTVNEVISGYHFTDFDEIEIQDYANRQKLVVSRQTALDYQKKKITDDQLLERFLVESQSIQEAFKLFGFNLPPDSGDKASHGDTLAIT